MSNGLKFQNTNKFLINEIAEIFRLKKLRLFYHVGLKLNLQIFWIIPVDI